MTNLSSSSRAAICERSIGRARRLLAQGEFHSRRISRVRVMFFAASAVTIALVYRAAWFHAGNVMVGLALIVFFLIVRHHDRVESRLAGLRAWIALKQDQVARSQVDWARIASRPFPHPPSHPYAVDLDLTGTHSVLGLLDFTVSSVGRKRLAEWVLNQNAGEDHRMAWADRQALIKELAPLAFLRDRLIRDARVIGADPLDAPRILALVREALACPRAVQIFGLSSVLCGLTWGLFLAAGLWGIPPYWLFSFGVYALLYFASAGQLKPLFDHAWELHDELEKLRAVTRVVERRHREASPRLHALCAPLLAAPDRVSTILAALARMCHGLSIKVHPLARLLLNALVPWDWYFGVRLQRTCRRIAHLLPEWLDRFATLDAAVSVATFAYLNPEYCWPVLRAGGEHEPGLSARNLGHPLIPPSRRVGNDLDLHGTGRILLLTGSNMSGKSTFLRTVGVAVCLAQAGAPVCAQAFEWSWVRVCCCISVSDSLEDGLSYFYAEVKRLKVLLAAVHERAAPPVLFLIDEIFKGTNNRERLSGSRAFIRALQRGHGFGLISTHDLELAQLEAESQTVVNAHFQETLDAGRLQFDYRLRPGVCPTTNALRIMASEGLPVPEDELGR